MIRRIALLWLCASIVAPAQDVVSVVRGAIARNDFATGENIVASYKAQVGVTPELVEAVSWMGRGALAARQLDLAERYAAEARKLALDQLSRRKLDAEPRLPLALGASIEVQARVMDARGQRGEALGFLSREIKTYWTTSIRARIQKNIHELSLEGKPAPALEVSKWLGPKPESLKQLRGKPLVLFFWAHWCADCKQQISLLARLAAEYGPKGLVVVGPTQHYGYVARGVEAEPEAETAYIDAIRRAYYSPLAGMPAPLSEENFRNYGVSSTPTLVMVDRKGIVQVYHPGTMAYAELVAGVNRIL